MELLQTRDKVIAAVVVVRVAEDLDIGMKGFQSMLGVLRAVSAMQGLGRVVCYPTIEFTILLVSPGPQYVCTYMHDLWGSAHMSRPGAPPCTQSRKPLRRAQPRLGASCPGGSAHCGQGVDAGTVPGYRVSTNVTVPSASRG